MQLTRHQPLDQNVEEYPNPGSIYIEQANDEGLAVVSLLRNSSRLLVVDDDSDSHLNERIIESQRKKQDFGMGVYIKDSYVTNSRRGHHHYYVVLSGDVTPEHASAIAAYLGSDPFHESLALQEYHKGDEHPWVADEKPHEIPGLLKFLKANGLMCPEDNTHNIIFSSDYQIFPPKSNYLTPRLS